MTPNGIECYDCGTWSITRGLDCPNDDGMGEPHATQAAVIEPCPNQVTIADWYTARREGTMDALRERCNSDVHEWKSGSHITTVED